MTAQLIKTAHTFGLASDALQAALEWEAAQETFQAYELVPVHAMEAGALVLQGFNVRVKDLDGFGIGYISQSDYGYSSNGCNPNCTVCGSSRTYCCDGKGGPWSEKYRGFKITNEPENGFSADQIRGCEVMGYCDTLDEVKAEIDDYLAGPDDDRARQAIGW